MCVSCACNGVHGAENKNNANAKGRERNTHTHGERERDVRFFQLCEKKFFVGTGVGENFENFGQKKRSFFSFCFISFFLTNIYLLL